MLYTKFRGVHRSEVVNVVQTIELRLPRSLDSAPTRPQLRVDQPHGSSLTGPASRASPQATIRTPRDKHSVHPLGVVTYRGDFSFATSFPSS